MRRKKIGWLVLAMTAALAGCIGESSKRSVKMTQAERDRLSAYVLDAPPSEIPNKVDINYENKIRLVGYEVEPAKVARPGTEVKLKMYWRCDQPLDDGWSLFTHLLDEQGRRIINIDNVGPLRELRGSVQAYPPSAWEKGKVYVDEQVFRIPSDTTASEIQIVTGIWKRNARLKVVSGPVDKENRGIVTRFKTGIVAPAGPAHTEVPTLRVNKLAKGTKIVIDGKLDDPAWKEAAFTGPFVEVGTGRPNRSFPVDGSAKLAWDDENLYVAFEVKDKDVRGGFDPKAVDPHLWTRDTVEIMLDPDGDGDNADYYEIQINPQNLVFDTQYDSYNKPKTEPDGPFGHQDWSAGLKSAVVVHGTIDKSDDEDEGYTVEAAIPWASFTKAKQSPPKPGDSWRMNFYAMQNNSGVAWSPILGKGNFHRASRFGRIVWAEAGEVAASATPSGAASAPAMPRFDPEQVRRVREQLKKRAAEGASPQNVIETHR